MDYPWLVTVQVVKSEMNPWHKICEIQSGLKKDRSVSWKPLGPSAPGGRPTSGVTDATCRYGIMCLSDLLISASQSISFALIFFISTFNARPWIILQSIYIPKRKGYYLSSMGRMRQRQPMTEKDNHRIWRSRTISHISDLSCSARILWKLKVTMKVT